MLNDYVCNPELTLYIFVLKYLQYIIICNYRVGSNSFVCDITTNGGSNKSTTCPPNEFENMVFNLMKY